MNYEKMLDKADQMAMNSPFSHMIGAIIVKRGHILGSGYSKRTSNIPRRIYRTHARSSKWNAIHAEIDALKDALGNCSNVRGATVVVSGYTKGGNRPVSCRPCSACMKVLKENGIRSAVFRLPDGFQLLKLREVDENVKVCTTCNQSISSWSKMKSDNLLKLK
jgi:deoxycytidylate deaminase